MKYEVSSDKTGSEDASAEVSDIKTGDHKITDKKAGEAHPAGHAVVNDKVILKKGSRVRIDSGKLGLVSETEARYGKASYFYKVNLDNQGDNSLGFRYVLGRDIYIHSSGTLIKQWTLPQRTSQTPTSFNWATDFK